MKKHTARNGRKMIIIFGWILIWQGLSVWIGNDILIAGPIEVGEALIRNIGNLEFIKSAGNSHLAFSWLFPLGLSLLHLRTDFQFWEKFYSQLSL